MAAIASAAAVVLAASALVATDSPKAIPTVQLAGQQDFADLSQGYHLDVGYGDCVRGQKTVNTQLRVTAMNTQITAGDGLWFEDATSPYRAGMAGCATLPPSSAPPPTSATGTTGSTLNDEVQE